MTEYTNEIDSPVDDVIYESIKPSSPQSFFLFAGAGSGKTRTLVNVLARFKEEFGQEYKLRNKRIAIRSARICNLCVNMIHIQGASIKKAI